MENKFYISNTPIVVASAPIQVGKTIFEGQVERLVENGFDAKELHIEFSADMPEELKKIFGVPFEQIKRNVYVEYASKYPRRAKKANKVGKYYSRNTKGKRMANIISKRNTVELKDVNIHYEQTND